jgi:hypothetical protein
MDELSAAQRRRLVVRVGFQGEPSTFRDVPRVRLNPAALNALFNCDVEFLQHDGDGGVLFPDSWVERCLPPPAAYVIRERVWPTLEPDALEQCEYRGGSVVVVEHVPPGVGAPALAAWLRAGLMDDDPEFTEHAQRLGELKAKLAATVRAIAELPVLRLDGAGGSSTSSAYAGDWAAKKERARTLAAQRERLEREVAAQEARWAAMEGGYGVDVDGAGSGDSGAFTLRLAEVRQPLGLAVWEASFAPTAKARQMAFIAVHKHNWRDFRLAVPVAPPPPVPPGAHADADADAAQPLVGKAADWDGAVPASHAEVNMRDVVVARRKHGRGLYRFADERGFYSGQWRRGLRHGAGVEINAAGRFQGGFRGDWRRGPGWQVTAAGDAYRGPYAATTHHPAPSLLYGDEYADGLPHGLGRATFVDGSVYEGGWAGGCPAGRGRYAGADGTVAEGHFGPWGSLHGLGTVSAHGRTRIGSWRHGALEGHGTEMDADGGNYEGTFVHGLRHGAGVETSAVLHGGTYDGWWRWGARTGRGVLNYSEPPRAGGALLGPSAEAEEVAAGLRAAGAARAASEAAAAAAAVATAAAEASTPAAALPSFLPPPPPPPVKQRQQQTPKTTATPPDAPQHIAYRGDYQLEGRWAAGLPAGLGVFTHRNGCASHLRRRLAFVRAGPNPQLPYLGATTVAAEGALRAKRDNQCRCAFEDALSARLVKEAENAASYAHWRREAEDAFALHVVRRTRRLRRDVDLIREDVAGQTAPPADLSFSPAELAALAAQEEWLDAADAAPPDGGGLLGAAS